jgi:DNA-binding CsgD family transcriptional regulator
VAPDTIIGRADELGAVERFFGREPSGARGLLIEGDAGIGKTTVWREAVRIAEGTGSVLASRASEAEAQLSFTVLGDLLVPALNDDVLARLPVGQRRALEVALLLAEHASTHPDARAISLAVLAVLRALTSAEAVTIAVDDVQWVDAPSARALTFALRRLEAERVSFLAARRVEPGAGEPLDLVRDLPGGLERITITQLDEGSLGRLLRRRVDREFPPPLVKKIHEQAAGNPFFAIEIGRALGTKTLSLLPGEPLPVPRDLEQLLQRRLSTLSSGARRACLFIAASPAPTDDVIDAACESVAGVQEAIDGGIVAHRGSRLEFTHPLLASTVFGSASAGERRRSHGRLAQVAADPEERARHLALSTKGPDEDVAAALEDAAQHATGRGALLPAAELFELAAALTPPSSDRIRIRRVAAAEALFDSGDAHGARRMVEEVLRRSDPGPQRADTLRVLAFMSWNDVGRISSLLTEALAEVHDDPALRSLILSEMAWAELEACRPATSSDLAREALALAEPLSDALPARLALKILSMSEAVLGRPARELADRATALEVVAQGESTHPEICLGRELLWAGDVAAAREVLDAALKRTLDQGRAGTSWEFVFSLAEVEFRAGRWELAAQHVNDALEIALDVGRSDVTGEILSVRAAIAAAMGRAEQAREDALETLAMCERMGDRWIELGARSVLGFLALSEGDPATAHEWLAPAVSTCREMRLGEPGAFLFLPDEVEALIGVGQVDEAERLTDWLEELGRELDRPLALATAARCRGLIAGARGQLEVASAHLDRALVEHGRVEHPFELARTLLVAGGVQRRMKQKRPARELLERARGVFDDLGAETWAARAQGEFARIGGRPPSPDGLTPTEAEVAKLVAQGLTNREVADALFVSPHTVNANLRRVYRKLQVRSRTELASKI